ncbi:MAG TPA: hypothetical protein VK929_13430 [Longimicrobiales bacterium]|nr:hypothetical protein [Longimicrobiales bacterium]
MVRVSGIRDGVRHGTGPLVAAFALLLAACDAGDTPAPPAATTPPAGEAPGDVSATWPLDDAAGVHVRRERAASLTASGARDVIIVTAEGPRYDSLDIRLFITNADGDTLWADAWNSSYYFYYDDLSGRSRMDVMTTVQAQVDTLLHDSRLTARGLPEPMQAADYGDLFRESTRYHLAELDWRNRASLRPAELTPAEAYDRINVEDVAPARVGVVLSEVASGPTYWYYAGGEASYVIGWSVREHAFVRIFSCC